MTASLPSASASHTRLRGIVERTYQSRNFGFLRRGVLYGCGRHIFFHRGSFRGAGTGPVLLPPAGARVSFVLVTAADGRLRAEDVVVELPVEPTNGGSH